ncbi:MAG: hypothetical protein CL758_03920 [Chloroflexi bacterium]|nr:hypothetical protein [Chloroflexota bacterium]|tara:strand:+ start:2632 stop:3249 length:618 start_codon:yes stop_codon:yes gene_type:complete
MTTEKPKDTCDICGTNNDKSALFCGICGNKLNSKKDTINQTQSNLNNESKKELNENLQDSLNNKTKKIGLISAIHLGFSNYFNFNGRSSRSEYWWWILFYILSSITPVIGPFINLASIIPTLSLTTRRLHDIDKTGWWQLIIIIIYILLFILLIPFFIATAIIGILAFIIWFIFFLTITIWWIRWMATKGNDGSNKFGPQPNIIH